MNQVFIYLLQVIAASALLYGYYHFALRNKKFHRYNRFYLLSAVVISVIIPFLNIPVYFSTNENDSSLVLQTLTVFFSPESYADEFSVTSNAEKFAAFFTISNMLYAVYIIIAIIFLSRIIISLNKIRTIVKNNSVEVLEKINFVSTDEPGTPFSFFRWLFWNRKIELKSEKGEQIFRHELFHIQQKHSWDIIFMELITVLFWINPFFHLMKKEVKAIHEFLADEFAINKNEKWQYAELLLMQALNTKTHLVNPFFHTLIKRRIAMITSSSKTSHQYLRKLLVLPVAALVVVLFAFSYIESINEKSFFKSNNESSRQSILDTIVPKRDSSVRIKGNITISDTSKPGEKKPLYVIDNKVMKDIEMKNLDQVVDPNDIESINILKGQSAIDKYGNKAKDGVIEIFTKKNSDKTNSEKTTPKEKTTDTNDENKVFEKLDVSPSFPGGDKEFRRYLERNLDANLPVRNGLKSGSYTVIIQFVVDKEGNISDLKPLTKYGYGLEAHVMDLIKKGPRWIPGKQNGHIVSAYQKQPVTFVIGSGKPDHSTDVTNKEGDKKYLNEVIMATGSGDEEKKIFNKVDDENKILNRVDIEASFPGGVTEWRNFLTKNLNSAVPVDSGAKAGKYTAVLQFIVHTDGHLSDLKALTDHGFGIEKECLRLMELSPKWNPAVQNGEKVVAYRKQPITFVISEE